MALDTSYVAIYSDYAPGDLDTEIENLKGALSAGENYVQQSSGDGKNYTKDPKVLKLMLEAAIHVRNGRRNPGAGNGSFVYDFRR
jgi:hypothetical protein